jgi:hypothetical protein
MAIKDAKIKFSRLGVHALGCSESLLVGQRELSEDELKELGM